MSWNNSVFPSLSLLALCATCRTGIKSQESAIREKKSLITPGRVCEKGNYALSTVVVVGTMNIV